jgi:GABA permease
VIGLWPGRDADFSNLTAHGGFLPNGPARSSPASSWSSSRWSARRSRRSRPPSRTTRAGHRQGDELRRRAHRDFYVGSIFLLAVILPWNSTEIGASPYVSAFEKMGIPGAADIMNAVVLTAVLSCLNSGLYTASRMLFVLAARREAPCS